MQRDGLHEKLNEFNNYGVLLRAPFAWRFNNHMCWNAGVIFGARVCTIACRGFCPFGGAFSRLGSAPEIIRKAPFVCNLVVFRQWLGCFVGLVWRAFETWRRVSCDALLQKGLSVFFTPDNDL